jgi:large subunit ribosomal protein L4
MASLIVYNKTGQPVGTYEIEPTELAPRINKQLLHDAVVMYRCNVRLGTVKTKARSEVAGTTKKMYRQKGTGNARAGSRRSGIRRGGGHLKAKEPKDWVYRLPRRSLQLATRMAVASKIRDNQVVVIDELDFAAPKTKDMAQVLKALKLDKESVLVTTDQHQEAVFKSARNIRNVYVAPVSELNALHVLRPKRLLVTRAALDAMKAKAEKDQAPGGRRSTARQG